jgi:GNAT superfamily N-acetyltransferase
MSTIRPARADDAEAIAELNAQLGYPTTVAELRERLEPILASAEDAVLVARDDADRPIGWVHVAVERGLEASFTAGLRGLVVDEAHRSRQLGHLLLDAAEDWARQHGCRVLTLRSRITRERAHRFYEREGYRLTKTSRVFEKQLL